MRKIKFRGKRLDNGEWIIGDLLHCKGEDAGRVFIKTDTGLFEVDPSTVGQFTGLFDKDGKEIYEGDIVNVSFGETVVPMQVVFAFGGWKMKEQHDDTPHDLDCYVGSNDVELIGNIHDNPELLKTE